MPSLTINYTAQEGQTVAAAAGRVYGYRDASGPRPATEAEVKKALIGVMKGWVEQVAQEDAAQQVVMPSFNPS